jgi:hypothetical protein
VSDPTHLNKYHERYLTVVFVEKGEILSTTIFQLNLSLLGSSGSILKPYSLVSATKHITHFISLNAAGVALSMHLESSLTSFAMSGLEYLIKNNNVPTPAQ